MNFEKYMIWTNPYTNNRYFVEILDAHAIRNDPLDWRRRIRYAIVKQSYTAIKPKHRTRKNRPRHSKPENFRNLTAEENAQFMAYVL